MTGLRAKNDNIGNIKTMAGKQNRRALLGQLANFMFKQILVDRIQAGERLVQHDEIRVVHDRGDELNFLRHSFGKFIHFGVGILSELKVAQPIQRHCRATSLGIPLIPDKNSKTSSTRASLYKPRSSGK